MVFASVVFLPSCDSWNTMWGDHSLGNNLSLLDGDKEQDRVIVFCLGRSAGACSGGIYVVPSYEHQLLRMRGGSSLKRFE
jgi:hypothetical protein